MEEELRVQLLIFIPGNCIPDYMESIKIRSIVKFLTNTELIEFFSGTNIIDVLSNAIKSKDATIQFRNFLFKNEIIDVLNSALSISTHIINHKNGWTNMESQLSSIKSDENTLILAFILNHGSLGSAGQDVDIRYSDIIKALDSLPSKGIILYCDTCHAGILANYFNVSKFIIEFGITNHANEIHELFRMLRYLFSNCQQDFITFLSNFNISFTKSFLSKNILKYVKILKLADGVTFKEFLENMHIDELTKEYDLYDEDILSIQNEFPDIPPSFFQNAKDQSFKNIKEIHQAVVFFSKLKVNSVVLADRIIHLFSYLHKKKKDDNDAEKIMRNLKTVASMPGILDLYNHLDSKNRLVEFLQYSPSALSLYTDYPIPQTSKIVVVTSCSEEDKAAIDFEGLDNISYGCIGSSEFLAALVMERGTVGDAIRRTIEEMNKLCVGVNKQIPSFATMNEDLLQIKVSDFLGDKISELEDNAISDASVGPFLDDYERRYVNILQAAGWKIIKRVDDFSHEPTKSSAVVSSQSEGEFEFMLNNMIDINNIEFDDSDSDYSTDIPWDITKNPRYFEYPYIYEPHACSEIQNRGKEAVIEFFKHLDALLEEASGPRYVYLETSDGKINIPEADVKLAGYEDCLDRRFRSYPFYCKTRPSLSYFLYKNFTDFHHDYYPLFVKAWENFDEWFDSHPYEYSDSYSDNYSD